MVGNRGIDFFDSQFERQTRECDFGLNPFEKIALPYVRGKTLDMGCGLGNLSIEAARRGSSVLALDASPSAIARIKEVAAAEALPLQAEKIDFDCYRIEDDFETIIAIGLFMFFPRECALVLLANSQAHVRAGGIAVVNVLIEGTTYLDMFEPAHYYLFARSELREHFTGWNILQAACDTFDAPGKKIKTFDTIVAQKPRAAL